jgi:hypothetical protein
MGIGQNYSTNMGQNLGMGMDQDPTVSMSMGQNSGMSMGPEQGNGNNGNNGNYYYSFGYHYYKRSKQTICQYLLLLYVLIFSATKGLCNFSLINPSTNAILTCFP